MTADKRVLGGRYEIDATLGEGGMAVVYAGQDTVLGRPVAVKVLSSRYANDATFVERFRREAQSAAAMNHPNVVNVYDTGSDDGTHFIVMELVEGRTLRDVIADDGPLLPERAAEIAEAVAAALAFAHERGIVHRDVKPGNIMITPTGDVTVMDFGIARAMSGDSLTQTATVLGTATYLSPEQAQGEPVDVRSDIYSLGVVLFEMLTATVPFDGESPVAVAYKHVREEAPRPSALNPDVPDPLERIVLKSLAKNPENRYASANDLRQDIARFLAGRPVAATPLLPPDQTEVITRQARETMVMPATVDNPERSGLRTAALILLVVLALGALAAGLWFLATNLIGDDPEPGQVEVPTCIGRHVDECRMDLEELGLVLEITERVPDENAAAGTVLTQDPEPGEQVDPDSTVSVVLSRGLPLVVIPNVIGDPFEEARAELEEAGFLVSIDDQPNEDVEEGLVFDMDPDPGKKVAKGSRVTLFVSEGPDTVQVPDLTNMTVAEAEAALEAVGLVLGQVDQGFCVPLREPGRVCDQSPNPGEEVEAGTAVDVIVQQQEESPSPSPSPSPTDSPTP